MDQFNLQFSQVELFHNSHLAFYLIQQELKSRKLFQILKQAGLEDCSYQPHLDSLILACVGLNNECQETFESYYTIIEERSRMISEENHSVVKQAMKVYEELMQMMAPDSAGEN